MIRSQTIGFIGAGNMGKALIEGCLRQGCRPDHLLIIEPDEAKRQSFSARGLSVMAEPSGDLEATDLLILCVKPQQMAETIVTIVPYLDAEVVISIAAGVTIQTLKQWLKTPLAVVRAMPNTPAMIGFGMTGLYTASTLTPHWHTVISELFEGIGKSLWLTSEEEIDAITAISGSGPAYFFYIMEAMIAGAKQLGFSERTAQMLVKQTALGAAELANQSGVSCGALRENVTSKGGTTAAALETLNRLTVDHAMIEAIMAAHQRSLEIAQQN